MAFLFCGFAGAQQQPTPIGELFATNGNQLVQPASAGMSVVPGSELSAGIAPARLKLYRGGQVRICPHTNLTVNSAPLGLMFAMDSGAVEVDYSLPQRGSEADRPLDSLITPDFSLQLAGPGRYHFALAANKQGDTCVKSLPGNSATVHISELMGSGSHQLAPQESVRFHDGKLNGSIALVENEACGCPETAPVQQIAAAAPAPVTEQPKLLQQPQPAPVITESTRPPAEKPAEQVQTKVEAPFVFSAKNATGPEPYSVARLTFSSLPNVYFVQETVDPVVLEERPAVVSVREQAPPQTTPTAENKPPQKKQNRGFFGRVKGFFGSLFGR